MILLSARLCSGARNRNFTPLVGAVGAAGLYVIFVEVKFLGGELSGTFMLDWGDLVDFLLHFFLHK